MSLLTYTLYILSPDPHAVLKPRLREIAREIVLGEILFSLKALSLDQYMPHMVILGVFCKTYPQTQVHPGLIFP